MDLEIGKWEMRRMNSTLVNTLNTYHMALYGRGNKKPLKKKPTVFDENKLVRLQVNHKTWVYVKPNLPENEIQRIMDKFKI